LQKSATLVKQNLSKLKYFKDILNIFFEFIKEWIFPLSQTLEKLNLKEAKKR